MKEKDRLKKKKTVISSKELEQIVFDFYKELKKMFETFSHTHCFLPIKFQREFVMETLMSDRVLHFRVQFSPLNEEKQTAFFKTYSYIEIPENCICNQKRFHATRPYYLNKLKVCKTAILKEIFEFYVADFSYLFL